MNIFQKKLENSSEVKKIITNIYRVQTYDSIMRGYFCNGFRDFMLKGKSLLEYTNVFLTNIKRMTKEKILLLFSNCNKCGSEDKKIFKDEESIEILKALGLITNIEEYQKI